MEMSFRQLWIFISILLEHIFHQGYVTSINFISILQVSVMFYCRLITFSVFFEGIPSYYSNGSDGVKNLGNKYKLINSFRWNWIWKGILKFEVNYWRNTNFCAESTSSVFSLSFWLVCIWRLTYQLIFKKFSETSH